MNKSLTNLLHEALEAETPKVTVDRAQAASALEREADRSLFAAIRWNILTMGVLVAPPILLSLWKHPSSGGDWGDSLVFRLSPMIIFALGALLSPMPWVKRQCRTYSVQKRFQLAALYRAPAWVGLVSALALTGGCWLARTGGDPPIRILTGIAWILVGCLGIPGALAARKASGLPMVDKRILAVTLLGGLAGLSTPLFFLAHRPPLVALLAAPLLGLPAVLALAWLSFWSSTVLARRLDPYWFE